MERKPPSLRLSIHWHRIWRMRSVDQLKLPPGKHVSSSVFLHASSVKYPQGKASSPWNSLLRTALGYPISVHVDEYQCCRLSLKNSMHFFRILTSLIHPWLKKEQYQGPVATTTYLPSTRFHLHRIVDMCVCIYVYIYIYIYIYIHPSILCRSAIVTTSSDTDKDTYNIDKKKI